MSNNDLMFNSQGGSLTIINGAGRPNINSIKKNQLPGQGQNNFGLMQMNMA